MAANIFAALSRVEQQKVYDPDTMTWVAMVQPGSSGTGTDVNVTNMIPAVETGLAKDVTLQELVDVLAQTALQFDASASPILYLGAAAPGSATSSAVWQITRFDVTSGVSQTYADGNVNFDNVWDNRASLSYS